jgi:hypothetical protein
VRLKQVISATLYGLVFTACGCVLSLIFGQAAILTCNRIEPSQIECVRQTKWLRWVPVGEQSIPELRGAEVGQSCDEDGCTYRVELNTAEGLIPLTTYFSSGAGPKQEATERINAFLQNPQGSSLTVRSDAGLLAFILPFAFVLVGPLIAMWSVVRAINR